MAMAFILLRWTLIFLIMWSVLGHYGVVGNDIVFDNCGPLHDGEVTVINVTLHKANFSKCDVVSISTVRLQVINPVNSAAEVVCEQYLSPCNSTENAQGCRCVVDGANGPVYKFEFNFRFNKSKHQGKTLDLVPDCASTGSDPILSQPCTNLTEETTSVTSPTSTGTANNKKTSDDDDETGKWVGIGVGCIVVAVILGASCIYCFVVPKKRKSLIVDPLKKFSKDKLKTTVDNFEKGIKGIITETNGCGKLETEVCRESDETYVLIQDTNIVTLNKALKKVKELIYKLIEDLYGLTVPRDFRDPQVDEKLKTIEQQTRTQIKYNRKTAKIVIHAGNEPDFNAAEEKVLSLFQQ